MIQKYGLWGFATLIFHKLRTMLFYSPARLIRFPFEMRNQKYIRIGKGFTTGKYCRIEAHPQTPGQTCCISIGENVQMNDSVHIVGSVGVRIGNDVLLASKIFISDLNHGAYGTGNQHDSPLTVPAGRPLVCSPVVIEDKVWIGEFVSVLPGVTIGEGSIIGTMSVVTKSIPAYSIAVGSPAKVIKTFNFETQQWEKL